MSKSNRIQNLLTTLEKSPKNKTAVDLGLALLMSKKSIEYKKKFFTKAFNLVPIDSELEAIINMWAVACMLEDKLTEVKKITAFRSMIKDPYVKLEWIENWIRIVWKRKQAPLDILNFIAIDLQIWKGFPKNLKKCFLKIYKE